MHLSVANKRFNVCDVITTSGARRTFAQRNPDGIGGIGGRLLSLRVQLDGCSERLEKEGKNSSSDDQHHGKYALQIWRTMNE